MYFTVIKFFLKSFRPVFKVKCYTNHIQADYQRTYCQSLSLSSTVILCNWGWCHCCRCSRFRMCVYRSSVGGVSWPHNFAVHVDWNHDAHVRTNHYWSRRRRLYRCWQWR